MIFKIESLVELFIENILFTRIKTNFYSMNKTGLFIKEYIFFLYIFIGGKKLTGQF